MQFLFKLQEKMMMWHAFGVEEDFVTGFPVMYLGMNTKKLFLTADFWSSRKERIVKKNQIFHLALTQQERKVFYCHVCHCGIVGRE